MFTHSPRITHQISIENAQTIAYFIYKNIYFFISPLVESREFTKFVNLLRHDPSTSPNKHQMLKNFSTELKGALAPQHAFSSYSNALIGIWDHNGDLIHNECLLSEPPQFKKLLSLLESNKTILDVFNKYQDNATFLKIIADWYDKEASTKAKLFYQKINEHIGETKKYVNQCIQDQYLIIPYSSRAKLTEQYLICQRADWDLYCARAKITNFIETNTPLPNPTSQDFLNQLNTMQNIINYFNTIDELSTLNTIESHLTELKMPIKLSIIFDIIWQAENVKNNRLEN